MHPTGLDDFLLGLFGEGKVVLRDRPCPVAGDASRVVAVLERAYKIHRLEVAGPLVEFDAKIAVRGAELVWRVCWALLHREETPEELLRNLRMPFPPSTADQHLSADLCFRYLPQVHRRSRGIDPTDALTRGLADLLREWPLSGVLADLDEGPAVAPDFHGHPGLMLLYSERLARRERISWKPGAQTLECLELVLQEMGRTRSPLLIDSRREA